MPILLVEHYLPLARALRRGLEEEGIVTHLARDDVEADAQARAVPYAAVLVDWNLPGKGGAALVRGWRRDGMTAPVLMFLPSANDADLLHGLDAGADDFLPLPFSFADLLARLRAWMGAPGAPQPAGETPGAERGAGTEVGLPTLQGQSVS
jgi:DNA-binding response OmpR family regulator